MKNNASKGFWDDLKMGLSFAMAAETLSVSPSIYRQTERSTESQVWFENLKINS